MSDSVTSALKQFSIFAQPSAWQKGLLVASQQGQAGTDKGSDGISTLRPFDMQSPLTLSHGYSKFPLQLTRNSRLQELLNKLLSNDPTLRAQAQEQLRPLLSSNSAHLEKIAHAIAQSASAGNAAAQDTLKFMQKNVAGAAAQSILANAQKANKHYSTTSPHQSSSNIADESKRAQKGLKELFEEDFSKMFSSIPKCSR
jgi:hypothetical protein